MTVMKGRLARVLARWRIIFILVSLIKLLLMVWVAPYGDLLNFALGAESVLGFLKLGRFPSFSSTGVYGPLQVLLAPFLWVWFMLPIEHPPILSIGLFSHSTSELIFAFLIKLPSFLADIGTGIVVLRLVKQLTNSDLNGAVAFLLWYANPFNIFWIQAFGWMDVIPTFILVLALMFVYERRWFCCGVCVSVATVLRLFPVLIVPFLLLAVKTDRKRAYFHLFSGLILPLMCGFVVLYATGAGTLMAIISAPLSAPWLLDFLGFKITSDSVRLVPVLLTVQFYVIVRYWRERTPLQLVAVSLLALLTAHTYGGINHHFIWVAPFLSVSAALNYDELWIFALTFVTGSLYPFIIPLPSSLYPMVHVLDPTYAGAFFAAKAAYLLKINLKSIRPGPFPEKQAP